MLKLGKIAITGSLGAGKSTVCLILKKLGSCTVDSDRITHELLNSSYLKKDLLRLLGEKVFKRGKADRRLAAEIVFNSERKLLQLEKLLHPRILKRVEEKYLEACKKKNCRLFVVEMPLLFEMGQESFFDYVVYVYAKQRLCRKRFKKSAFLQRSRRFLPQREKMKKADFVIDNSKGFTDLEKQTFNLYTYLTQKEFL